MLPSQKKKRGIISFWKLHFDGQDDGLGLIIKGTTGQIRSYHRQADDLNNYYLVLQRTSNLILRSKNADILAWIERSCSRSIQARISRISAEGAPVGKKSEGATPVSKNDHSRQAWKWYQNTEPDPKNTLLSILNSFKLFRIFSAKI